MSSVFKYFRKGNHHPHRTMAFTLLEVMIALIILGTGLLGVYSAIARAAQINGNNRRLQEAAEIAHKQLTLATMLDRGSLLPDTGNVGQFTWESQFTDKSLNLVIASVTVTWQQQGANQSVVRSEIFYPTENSE